jgi:DNA-binding MarR family transcriptional regulator
MDKTKASFQIMELFLRMINTYNAMEKMPDIHGDNEGLYHSERHMLDTIAKYPDLNMSEHAAASGVTKGAISQVVKKLSARGFVKRYKKGDNDKAVYLELTRRGKDLAGKRIKANEQTLSPLIQELGRHSEKEISFLVDMFIWIDQYLAQSRDQMAARSKKE